MSSILLSQDALLSIPSPGQMEYNGTSMYFTPSGVQRGVVPGQQMFVLNTAYTGTQATTAQSVFGLTNGVTLNSSTIYKFQIVWFPFRTAGTTSHTVSLAFGGTATINQISASVIWNGGTSYAPSVSTTGYIGSYVQTSGAAVQVTNARGAATDYQEWYVDGTVSINAGGTFNPQYVLSAAPGGAYTTPAGSWMLIYPLASSTANVSIGTWS